VTDARAVSTTILMLVQIDDRSGEDVGHAVDELMAMGVHNVQLLTSQTKKGRPGMVLLLDLDRSIEGEVAVYLAAELGAWGYHVLQTTHRHFEAAQETRQVTLCCGTERRSLEVRCKLFRHAGKLLRVKLEHDDAVRLRSLAREFDHLCSLEEIRPAVERAARLHPDAHEIEVDLSE
jgi:uncharacterized protein (DUF111 family)